jgi:hypothetical protein
VWKALLLGCNCEKEKEVKNGKIATGKGCGNAQ